MAVYLFFRLKMATHDLPVTHDLLLVYSPDAKDWSNYFKQYLCKDAYCLDVCVMLDVEVVKLIQRRNIADSPPVARTYIVIVSPEHLLFLQKFEHFSYADLVSEM